ncbi:MAG: hypothetical protein WC761_04975 [Candidatus Paceibacterota bacterium]|jgi:hypothetical protein
MNPHQSHFSTGEQQQQQRRSKQKKVIELSKEEQKVIESRQIDEALAALFFPQKKSPFESDL